MIPSLCILDTTDVAEKGSKRGRVFDPKPFEKFKVKYVTELLEQVHLDWEKHPNKTPNRGYFVQKGSDVKLYGNGWRYWMTKKRNFLETSTISLHYMQLDHILIVLKRLQFSKLESVSLCYNGISEMSQVDKMSQYVSNVKTLVIENNNIVKLALFEKRIQHILPKTNITYSPEEANSQSSIIASKKKISC